MSNSTCTPQQTAYIVTQWSVPEDCFVCDASIVWDDAYLGFHVVAVEKQHVPCIVSALLAAHALASPLVCLGSLDDAIVEASRRFIMRYSTVYHRESESERGGRR